MRFKYETSFSLGKQHSEHKKVVVSFAFKINSSLSHVQKLTIKIIIKRVELSTIHLNIQQEIKLRKVVM